MNSGCEKYLSEEEETLLLRIARDSLETFVRTGEHLNLEAYPLTETLREKRGAFVTLRREGTLRGCIGYTKHIEALAEAVRDNAINCGGARSAFRPRHRRRTGHDRHRDFGVVLGRCARLALYRSEQP